MKGGYKDMGYLTYLVVQISIGDRSCAVVRWGKGIRMDCPLASTESNSKLNNKENLNTKIPMDLFIYYTSTSRGGQGGVLPLLTFI